LGSRVLASRHAYDQYTGGIELNIPHPLTKATAPSRADAARTGRDQEADLDRYDGIRQYSLVQVLAAWTAATAPMAALVWLIAPWLSHHLGGREPLAEAP
jgi:hypothetical protein